MNETSNTYLDFFNAANSKVFEAVNFLAHHKHDECKKSAGEALDLIGKIDIDQVKDDDEFTTNIHVLMERADQLRSDISETVDTLVSRSPRGRLARAKERERQHVEGSKPTFYDPAGVKSKYF